MHHCRAMWIEQSRRVDRFPHCLTSPTIGGGIVTAAKLHTQKLLTVVGWRLHRVHTWSGISDIREEVNTRLHESDLQTQRVVTRRVEQMKSSVAEQPVECAVPAVQVVLIELVCNACRPPAFTSLITSHMNWTGQSTASSVTVQYERAFIINMYKKLVESKVGV